MKLNGRAECSFSRYVPIKIKFEEYKSKKDLNISSKLNVKIEIE